MSESDKPVDASFLERWSRRKVAANEPAPVAPLEKSSTGAVVGEKMPETPHPEPTLPAGRQTREELPAIDSLTHEADFSPFMAKEVDPGLRNQAMKKLFTDPHYQFAQMDKLDIYIDDYSKPDPIPMEMLRKMNQAARLGLFDDEEKDSPSVAVVPAIDADGSDSAGTDATVDADARLTAPREDASAAKVFVAESDLHQVAGAPGTAGKKNSA